MLKRRARGRRRAAFKSTQIASFARGPTSRRRTRRVRENAAPRRDPARRRTRRRDGDDTFGVETGRNVRRRRLKFAATTLVTTLGAMVGIILLRTDKTMQNDGHALVDLGMDRVSAWMNISTRTSKKEWPWMLEMGDYFSKMNTSAFESVLDEEPELGVSVGTAAEAEHVRLLIVRDELMMRLRKAT